MDPVALVSMPFAAVNRPSVALAVLKRALKRRRIPAHVHYLNMRMARRLDLERYSSISSADMIGDWLFSQHLFGEYGSGELRNSYADLREHPVLAQRLLFGTKGYPSIVSKEIPRFLEECFESIRWDQYRVVGFSSVFAQQLGSLLLAKKIKERYPHVRIVFGGANVHGPMGPAALRSFPWLDYTVDGEAEEVFPRLVECLDRGEEPRGLHGVSMRIDGSVVAASGPAQAIGFQRSPIPDYADYYEQLRAAGFAAKVDPVICVEGSRGCWWGEKAHCTFCGLNGQLMKYRVKPAKRLVREIQTHARRYQTLNFEAVDNILSQDPWSDYLPRLKRTGLDLNFFYEVKSNLTNTQVEMLASAGIRRVQPGIESLHTEVLKLMKKGTTGLQNVQFLKWCQLHGVSAAWNLLFGFPGEKRSYYEETLRWMSLITHLPSPFGVNRVVIQRFAPYHNRPEDFGLDGVRPDSRYQFIYPTDRLDMNELAFDFGVTPEDPELKTVIRRIRRVAEQWEQRYFTDPDELVWRRGDSFVQILDSRALPRVRQERRWITLSGLDAEVFAYCDSIRSFADVHRMAREVSGVDDEAATREILSRLLEKKIMLTERDSYLSLAIRAK